MDILSVDFYTKLNFGCELFCKSTSQIWLRICTTVRTVR